MRASTLFALSAAILLGLGAVVFAKYSGWFDRTPVFEEKKAPYQILVAKTNLFEGAALSANDVYVRNVREDEKSKYLENQARLLPPLPTAANARVLIRSVGADEPLMYEHFSDLALPKSMTARLEPNMRAVNISLPADQAGGGLLQLNERVDVYLTSDICADPKCTVKTSKTAQIARNARVIVKRNILFSVMAPVDPTKPHTFTLETNPYRAALIEFAKTKGQITLVPAPAISGVKAKRTGFSDPDSEEYRDEDARVAAVLAGELSVGEADLARIFRIKPAAPLPPPLMVERISGVNSVGSYVFPAGGALRNGEPPIAAGFAAPTGSFFFAPGKGTKDCPTCGSTPPRPINPGY